MSDHDATHDATHDLPDGSDTSPLLVAGAWALVGVPLLYGLWQTLLRAVQLFG